MPLSREALERLVVRRQDERASFGARVVELNRTAAYKVAEPLADELDAATGRISFATNDGDRHLMPADDACTASAAVARLLPQAVPAAEMPRAAEPVLHFLAQATRCVSVEEAVGRAVWARYLWSARGEADVARRAVRSDFELLVSTPLVLSFVTRAGKVVDGDIVTDLPRYLQAHIGTLLERSGTDLEPAWSSLPTTPREEHERGRPVLAGAFTPRWELFSSGEPFARFDSGFGVAKGGVGAPEECAVSLLAYSIESLLAGNPSREVVAVAGALLEHVRGARELFVGSRQTLVDRVELMWSLAEALELAEAIPDDPEIIEGIPFQQPIDPNQIELFEVAA
ncbi:hypothetical protein AXK58_25405 [Tsukamurella tyrosinosolvens]|nr:hypothetical protein AXK58_25405 [Tsukamurella tyrosinosolvens]